MTSRAEARRRRRRAERSLRSRRVRALLASGLVLGIGTTVTLAAWNDSEFASGSLTAGTFQLEGSADGVEYSTSDASEPHVLSFIPGSEPMFPGSTQYALFSVRTAENSLGGTVQVLPNEGNSSELGAHLTYGLSLVEGTTCDAETFESGTAVVAPGTGLTVGPDSSQEVSPNQESPLHYCLELHLPTDADNEAQGLSATPSWEFLGTSVSE